MTWRLHWLIVGSTSIAAAVAACGSGVSESIPTTSATTGVTTAAAGGAGGAAASGGGSATSAAGGSSTTGAATGGASTGLCGDFCAKLDSLSCPIMDCDATCAFWVTHAGDCADPFVAYISCITSTITSCSTIDSICPDELSAVEQCGGQSCLESSCSGSGSGGQQTCECSGGCADGVVDVSCVTDAGVTSCQCSLGGQSVGACTETGEPCDVIHGCCAQFF